MMTTSSFPNSDNNNSQNTCHNIPLDTGSPAQQDISSISTLKKTDIENFANNEMEGKDPQSQSIKNNEGLYEGSKEDSDHESSTASKDTIKAQESEEISTTNERRTRSSTTRRRKANRGDGESSSQSSMDTEDQDETSSVASTSRHSTRPRRSSIQKQRTSQNVIDSKTNQNGRRITLRHSKRRGSLSSTNSVSASNVMSGSKTLLDGRQSQPSKKKISGKVPPNTIDLGKLDVSSLKKYRKAYKLRINPGSTRLQLLQAIQEHHQRIKVDEFDVVSRFIDRVKSEDAMEGSMGQAVSPGRIHLNGKVLGLHVSQSGK